jgi:SAM-dependent methyltransferase
MSSAPVDFGPLAAQFDRFLPLIAPVGEAVLAHLSALNPGATVLDVACGTGEPGLTLARRQPGLRVVGVDESETMLGVARQKADAAGIDSIRFSAMPMTALQMPDQSVDAVISRFGLLLFGDVSAAAAELARVLRPGAPYALAVWDVPEENRLMRTATNLVIPHLPEGPSPVMAQIAAWAAPGRRAALLEGLGLGPVQTEPFVWNYHLASFDEAWTLVSGMARMNGMDRLSEAVQADIRADLAAALSVYAQPDGRLVIPHACRLFWGRRAVD